MNLKSGWCCNQMTLSETTNYHFQLSHVCLTYFLISPVISDCWDQRSERQNEMNLPTVTCVPTVSRRVKTSETKSLWPFFKARLPAQELSWKRIVITWNLYFLINIFLYTLAICQQQMHCIVSFHDKKFDVHIY